MGFHKNKWSDQFQFWDALFYHHYVDDITCSFNPEQDAKIR